MFNRILASTDGSEPASHALELAANMAEREGAELVVISVLPRIPVFFSEEADLSYYSELQERSRKGIEDLLKRTEDELQRDHESLKVKTIMKEGNPAKNIVETARDEGVDLIIMGNRGAGGLVSWMLGSTSRTVVEACTVPVLVVKDQQFCESP